MVAGETFPPGNASRALSDMLRQAIALHQQGNMKHASSLYEQVLAEDPGHAEALQGIGFLCAQIGRFEEALKFVNRACEAHPDFSPAHFLQGLLLQQLKRYEDALTSFDRTLAINPNYVDAYHYRGVILELLKRHEEALNDYEKALRLNQNVAKFHVYRANALRHLERYEEALMSFDRALALQAEYPEASHGKAHVKLLLGDYDEGWRLNEWRWKTDVQKRFAGAWNQPMWLGDRPVSGMRVLLHSEQGFGDDIQMVRYIPQLEALGATVILGTRADLVPLFRTLKGNFSLVTEEEPFHAFDLHCPMMSLPLAFKTRVETISAQVPYLFADTRRREVWREWLGPRTKLRVGLVWAGSPTHAADRYRSMSLQTLAPLLEMECEFFVLQKDISGNEAALLSEMGKVRNHDGQLQNFADTAALIAELDLVITVDTAVAHLAGAMGMPVWIMLPVNPDFRWMLSRSDSPWYPTARLFRQRRLGDWGDVIGEVCSALQGLMLIK